MCKIIHSLMECKSVVEVLGVWSESELELKSRMHPRPEIIERQRPQMSEGHDEHNFCC